MVRKFICILLSIVLLTCVLSSCQGEQGPQGEQGEKGADGISPTIEISEDGYWVINGVKTDVLATSKQKEFVIGEEILFEEGKEFTLMAYDYFWKVDDEYDEYVEIIEPCKITAKLVAKEEYSLDAPSDWPYPGEYDYSYRYRLYVKGYYCDAEHTGETFNYTMSFRTVPYNGVDYRPSVNYESTTVGEDGYFEFSVDVYTKDVVTDVLPVSLRPKV